MLGGLEILTSRFLLHPTDLDRSLLFYEQTIGLAIYREWRRDPRAAWSSSSAAEACSSLGREPSAPSGATGLVLQVRDMGATHASLVERASCRSGAELNPGDCSR